MCIGTRISEESTSYAKLSRHSINNAVHHECTDGHTLSLRRFPSSCRVCNHRHDARSLSWWWVSLSRRTEEERERGRGGRIYPHPPCNLTFICIAAIFALEGKTTKSHLSKQYTYKAMNHVPRNRRLSFHLHYELDSRETSHAFMQERFRPLTTCLGVIFGKQTHLAENTMINVLQQNTSVCEQVLIFL